MDQTSLKEPLYKRAQTPESPIPISPTPTLPTSLLCALVQMIHPLFVYDRGSNPQGPISFFVRWSLWLTTIGVLIAIAMSLLQNDPVTKRFLYIDLMLLLPGAIVALTVAYSDHKRRNIYANMIVHTAIYIAFMLSLVPPSTLSFFPATAHQATANYYIYLPLIALSYMSLLIIWGEHPKAVGIFVALHSLAVGGVPMLLDPSWREQLGAFCVFYITVAALFIFNFILHRMIAAVQQSRFQHLTVNSQSEASDKLFKYVVEMSFPALICFDSTGNLITKRGKIVDRFLPSPAANDDPLMLHTFLQFFQKTFHVDLSVRNDRSHEISFEGSHFWIHRRDSSELITFAFIDISERIRREAKPKQPMALEMPW